MATESAVVNGHAVKVPPNACAHTYTPGLLSRPSLQGVTANGEMQNCPSVENKRLTLDRDINSLSPTEAKGMSEKGSQEGCCEVPSSRHGMATTLLHSQLLGLCAQGTHKTKPCTGGVDDLQATPFTKELLPVDSLKRENHSFVRIRLLIKFLCLSGWPETTHIGSNDSSY